MKKLFIGIDFSKKKFDATVILAAGLHELEERKWETFTNDPKGFRHFIKWVKQNAWKTTQEEWLFCGEDTGACSISLSRWLYGRGYDMWLANAYAIKHSSGIQRVKSDKADSAVIAEYAWRHQDKAQLFEPIDENLQELREIFLYRHKLVEQRVKLQVRSKEKDTVRGKSKALSFVERKTRHLIEELSKAIKQCDDKMKEIIAADEALRENYDIITSMRGVALQNAACLMIYTNNFKKFDYDSRKIACYYGVAPFGKQSGTSVNLAPRTSHFANKLIKSLLGQAAHVAKEFEPEIRAYYDRMIQKGKKRQVAINNVKNKILHILVAMVKKKEKYNPNSNKKENVKDFALWVNF
jgi:transposase